MKGTGNLTVTLQIFGLKQQSNPGVFQKAKYTSNQIYEHMENQRGGSWRKILSSRTYYAFILL